MTYLAPKLRERVQIRKATQSPNDQGGFDRDYDTLLTIWAQVQPISFGSFLQQRKIRGSDIAGIITHIAKIRRTAISTLGVAFTAGFSNGFDNIQDISILKADYYFFVERSGSSIKGKLFKVVRTEDFEERREYTKVMLEEIEEVGTGYPA
jgi:hypothetical protein